MRPPDETERDWQPLQAKDWNRKNFSSKNSTAGSAWSNECNCYSINSLFKRDITLDTSYIPELGFVVVANAFEMNITSSTCFITTQVIITNNESYWNSILKVISPWKMFLSDSSSITTRFWSSTNFPTFQSIKSFGRRVTLVLEKNHLKNRWFFTWVISCIVSSNNELFY